MNFLLFLQAAEEIPVPEEIDFGMLILRMFVYLALILVLIYFLLRKVLPLFVHGGTASQRVVRVLNRIPLEQKRSLVVVEILDKVYLLASAEGQISILMELDREKVFERKAVAQPPVAFQDVLKKVLSRSGKASREAEKPGE